MEYVLSEKGKPKIVKDGYLYNRDKVLNNKTFWKCEKFAVFKCRARLHTVNENIVKFLGDHNHAADVAGVKARQVVNSVKQQAANTQESCQQLVSTAVVGVSSAVAARLPSKNTMKRTIRRIRQHEPTRANPTSLDDFDVPDELKTTCTGTDFLLFDSGRVADRMLMFSTHGNLQLLANGEHWFADGTFKTVPPLFQQLYTIHVIIDNTVTPVVYCLLQNKTVGTYKKMLDELKILQPLLQPISILIDFEAAAIHAFEDAFPNARTRGCFFHFSQCVYRQIQANGLQRMYESDEEFALQIRHLPAIAYVPAADVVKIYEELVDTMQFSDEVQPLLDYFEDTWIGRPIRGNRRRRPLFSHLLWNCYSSVVDGLPRTNNVVEGWHRSFAELMGCHHPSLWKFINVLRLEQNRNEVTLEQHLAGQPAAPKKKKYRDCDVRIATIVARYEDTGSIDYLRAVAHNFNF